MGTRKLMATLLAWALAVVSLVGGALISSGVASAAPSVSPASAIMSVSPTPLVTGVSPVTSGSSSSLATGPPPAGTRPARLEGQVVVLGVPGLRWDDLDPARTPNLWRLAARSSTASLSTRTIPPPGLPITCPVSGWLTVSAGQRAGAPGPGCGAVPTPRTAPDGSATISEWAALADFQQSTGYRAQIGRLADTIIRSGGTVAAIGPGAALAAADPTGKVQKYAPNVASLPDLRHYTVVFAEAGEIVRTGVDTGPGRMIAVSEADRTVGAVLARVPPDRTVLVTGLSDSGVTAHLHVAMATGPGGGGTGREPYRRSWLTASSTRQDALVTLTDLTATVCHALGIPSPEVAVSRPWRDGDPAPRDVRTVVRMLADADQAGQVLRRVREPFFIVLVSVQLLFYGIAAVVIRRYHRILAVTRVVAVASGALPVSAFLAQLVPWWSTAWPMPALIGAIVAFAGAITVVAWAGPWRRHVLGPPTVVAGVSSLALLVDVLAGLSLQVNAVSGYEPMTGGRFFGFGNMAFAVFSTGTILLLAGGAQAFLDRGRRHTALAVCLAYGLLAVVVDGWPGWGADFGGVPSFVAGLAVFLLLLSGRPISVVRLGLVGLAGAVLIGLIAVLDWLRPAGQRTHLGTFVQQTINGEAGPIVMRKLGAMLHTLGNLPLALLALAAVTFLFLVLSRPSRWGASALTLAYRQAPALRAGLFGALTAAVVGFAVNDSGIAIPAMALTLAIPLTLAACVRALQLAPPFDQQPSGRRGRAGRPSAPTGPTAPPAA